MQARIAGELHAVINDSELATQKILAAAEDIDQAANNLSVALKGDFEHGLAQDIRDRVIADFRGLQLSGPDQPARRQSDGDVRRP